MALLYRIFLKGLFAVLPITITLYLLIWIASVAESIFGGPFQEILPAKFYFPGLGVVVFIFLILLVGSLVNNYLAAQAVRWFEATLQKVPFVKAIYNPLRDVMNLFANEKKGELKRVVMVTFPNVGLSMLGLVTRENFTELPARTVPPDHLAVFVPYSYAVGGFTLIVPKQSVREVDLPVEKAMQLAITAWIKSDRNSATKTQMASSNSISAPPLNS